METIVEDKRPWLYGIGMAKRNCSCATYCGKPINKGDIYINTNFGRVHGGCFEKYRQSTIESLDRKKKEYVEFMLNKEAYQIFGRDW